MKATLVRSLALGVFLAACAGGASPIPLATSAQNPAAEGWVTPRFDGNGNVRLNLEVKHMAPPERLAPNAKVFAAWVQPPGGVPQNVGVLQIDQNRIGRLETVTPFLSFELFITAEEYPAVTTPAGPRVMGGAISL